MRPQRPARPEQAEKVRLYGDPAYERVAVLRSAFAPRLPWWSLEGSALAPYALVCEAPGVRIEIPPPPPGRRRSRPPQPRLSI